MNITEFLEARITEDERPAYYYGSLALGVNRILAECAAKRVIIGHHVRVPDVYGDADGDTCSICTETGPMPQGWPCFTVNALAAVYSDHPDYQQDWA